jgi:pimeloyl-[acyl-carrier protein] synthase
VQEATRRAGLDAQLELATYFDALLAERRENPREDLMTDLLRAQQEGDRLSAQEVVSTCILLLIAGHETTTNLIGNGMLTLLEHPDALSHLRDHPDQMRSAVEEMMRFTAPVQRVARRTDAKPVQVGETTIPPGQFILLLVAAANRDPRVFVEPQTFDISRDPNPHLGFGRGIHFCIGAPLARLEAEISFRILLERLPRVRRADDAPLSWLPSTIFHGLRALPLAF